MWVHLPPGSWATVWRTAAPDTAKQGSETGGDEAGGCGQPQCGPQQRAGTLPTNSYLLLGEASPLGPSEEKEQMQGKPWGLKEDLWLRHLFATLKEDLSVLTPSEFNRLVRGVS